MDRFVEADGYFSHSSRQHGVVLDVAPYEIGLTALDILADRIDIKAVVKLHQFGHEIIQCGIFVAVRLVAVGGFREILKEKESVALVAHGLEHQQ